MNSTTVSPSFIINLRFFTYKKSYVLFRTQNFQDNFNFVYSISEFVIIHQNLPPWSISLVSGQ